MANSEITSGQFGTDLRTLPLTEYRVAQYLEKLMALDAHTIGESWGPDQWFRELPQKWEFSRFLLRGREPIGFVVASLKDEAIHIHRLVVSGAYRGRGCGAKLLREVAEMAQQRSLRTLTLKVSSKNCNAITFYRSLGFAEVHTSSHNLELSVGVRELIARTVT